MMQFLQNVNDWVVTTIESFGAYGAVFSCLLIVVESIMPVLPLTLFIAINFLYYGFFIGFVISWFFTIIGCIISFFLCQKLFRKIVDNKIRKIELAGKLMNKIDKMKLSSLVLLIAMPFTPAFVVNIVAGVSNINFKKFFISILIGKVFLVFFWGFIGVGFVESLKNPYYLVIIGGLLVLAYFVSTLVNKKLKID